MGASTTWSTCDAVLPCPLVPLLALASSPHYYAERDLRRVPLMPAEEVSNSSSSPRELLPAHTSA